MNPSQQPDVLVIGAGMAGLTCARQLAEQGRKVLILEARSRVGGRIATVTNEGQEPVELGAEFVHGQPPELLALIAEAGLETYERDGTQVCLEDQTLTECDDRDATFEPLEDLKHLQGADLSFTDYLAIKGIPEDQRTAAIGYVEGFNAADANLASARALGIQQTAEDSIDGDRVFKLRGGYDQLPNFLATRLHTLGADLRLDHPVRSVTWQQGTVSIETTHETFTAPQAVITLPLALLQANTPPITPAPPAILEAASLMRMGDVCRFTLTFRSRFWQDLHPQPAMQALSFLFTFTEFPSVWWTPYPNPTASLTGWVGGPRALTLLAQTDDQLRQVAIATLAHIFHLPEAFIAKELTGFYTHNWTADPFARGSYSYVAVGGAEASAHMSLPVENTLFFAGEHTDTTGHWGTVHGAIRSGFRAAHQILNP